MRGKVIDNNQEISYNKINMEKINTVDYDSPVDSNVERPMNGKERLDMFRDSVAMPTKTRLTSAERLEVQLENFNTEYMGIKKTERGIRWSQ